MKKMIMMAFAVSVAGMVASCGNCSNKAGEAAADTTVVAVAAVPEIDTVMTIQTPAFLMAEELQWESPVKGLKRQIMGYNDNLMMVKIDFEAGCDGGGAHSHPHSQSSVVVSGVFDVTIDGVTQTLKAGDGFYVAPNKMHVAVCKEAGTLIDSFSPVRADFLKK